jgi:hypothetical protein
MSLGILFPQELCQTFDTAVLFDELSTVGPYLGHDRIFLLVSACFSSDRLAPPGLSLRWFYADWPSLAASRDRFICHSRGSACWHAGSSAR